MNLLACIHTRGVEKKLILLLLFVIASIGCATTKAPFAQLENVVKENRLAAGAEVQGLQVTRGDASLTTVTGMALQKGDRIVTDGTTEAVILFGDAYEVILGSDTEISISPDIFLKFGKAVVKKLKETREKFRVETEYVNAGVKGTEFAISVDRGNVVTLVVREGAVIVESKTGSWDPVIYDEYKWPAGTVRGNEEPVKKRMAKRELERAFEWARGAVAMTRPIAVPDVTGLPLDRANQRLSEAGLPAGRVENVPAEGRPLRTVLGQSPRAGERVRLGTRVNLRVAAEATVPDLRGMTALEAGIVLGIAGLKVGETSETEDSEAKPGKVVRQSPAPGTKVPPGSAVALVTASRTASRSSLCTVPDIRQANVEDAPRVLEAAGLKLGNVTRREGGHTQQTPEPGARVACGSSVDLVIGGGIR